MARTTVVRRNTAALTAALVGAVGAVAGCSDESATTPGATRTEGTTATVTVALAPLAELPSDAGQVVMRGRWGPRLGQFGLFPPSRRGPTSFGLTSDGGIVVVDQQNHRVVLHEAEQDRAVVTGIRPIYYDVAADGDRLHLLTINGGVGGADSLRTFGLDDGSPVRSRSVGDDAARILAVSGDVYVGSLGGGWRRVGEDAPAQPAIPTDDGGEIRVGGGRGRWVTIDRSDADGTTSWRLTSAESLGVVAATANTNGVRAVLVRWTDTSRAYQYVELGPTGVLDTFAMPDRAFAEMTAGAEFRFHDGVLYRAASTRQGFSIHRYGGPDAPARDARPPRLASRR